jgi:aminopeptidase N
VDGRTQTQWLRFNGEQTELTATFSLGTEVSEIRVDPHGRLLFALEFNPGEAILKETAKSAPCILNRIHAYNSLIDASSATASQIAHDLIALEPFYGVRVEVAKRLAKSKSMKSVRTLAEMLRREKHPMALWHLARVSMIRDPLIRASVRERLQNESKTLPYRAHDFLLQALGHQMHPDDLSLLLTTAKDESLRGYHQIVRAGAYRALGRHGSTESHQYLTQVVASGKEHPNALAAAIDGLSTAVLMQTPADLKRTVAVLEPLACRDEHETVRKAAIGALLKCSASGLAGSVWQSRAMYAKQDWVWLENQVEALKKSAEKASGYDSLVKRVEELEAVVRRLEKDEDKKSSQ